MRIKPLLGLITLLIFGLVPAVYGVEVNDARFGIVLQGQRPTIPFTEDAGVVIGEIPFEATADPPFTITPASGKTRGQPVAFAIGLSAGTPPGTYVNKKIRINFHQRTGDDIKEVNVSAAVVPNPVLGAQFTAVAKKISTGLDFGDLVVGNRTAKTFQIINKSGSQLAIRAKVSGFQANIFSPASPSSFNLAPNGSATIEIRYPVDLNLGKQSAAIDFSTEVIGLPGGQNTAVPAPAGQLSVSLTGNVLSNVNIPTTLDFGNVQVNSSAQRLLDIVNLASAQVLVGVPSTAGSFQLAPISVSLKDAGQRASIVVTLPPQSTASQLLVPLEVRVSDGDQGDAAEIKKVTIKANVVP